jgi:hypothetical protein
MSNRRFLPYVYLIIGAAFVIGWPFIQNSIWPPPPKPQQASQKDLVGLVAGTPAWMAEEVEARKLTADDALTRRPPLVALADWVFTALDKGGVMSQAAAERRRQEEAKAPKPEFLAMGRGEKPYNLQPLFTSKGGAIQQVILSNFQEADREGLAVKNPDGTKSPLHLIPGVKRPRSAE